MKKYIKWILLGLLMGVIIFMVKLPSMVQGFAVTRLEENLGRRVEAGRFRYNYARNILYIEDFKIYEEDGERLFAYFEFFNVNIDIIHLIRGVFYIRELTLVDPSLRIEHNGERWNYEDILENIGREKKEEAAGKEEGFIKKVDLKDVTVESFVLYYEDRVIKAENDFTLETPQILYEGGIFTLDSVIDFYKKGKIAVDIEYKEDGSLAGTLETEKLLLNDKLYIPKAIYNLESIEGVVDSALEFTGNVKTLDFTVKGTLDGRKLRVVSKEMGELFYLDTLKGEVEEITPLQGRYRIRGSEISQGRIDIVRIMEYTDSISSPEEEKEEVAEEEKTLDIRVDSFKTAGIDLTTPWGNFTQIEGDIQKFNSGRGSKFFLNTSFVYNGDTQVGVRSENTLVEGLNIGAETLISVGNVKITGKDLEFLKDFISEERSYDFSSGAIDYDTEYTYAYPKLSLKNTLVADKLVLNNLMESYPLLSAGKVSTENTVEYDFKEGGYRVAGDIELGEVTVADRTGRNAIQGRELRASIQEIVSGRYLLDTLILNSWRIVLEKGEEEEGATQEGTEYPIVGIEDLQVSDTTITEERFTLGIVSFRGSSLGTQKGVSDIDLRGTFNGAAVEISGRSERIKEIKRAEDLKNLTFNGRAQVRSLQLEDIDLFLEEKYNLKGSANITSSIDYSGDNLDTDNTITMTGASLERKDIALNFDNLTSNNTLSMKDGRYTVDGGLSLQVEELTLTQDGEEYTLRGYVDIKSRGSYSEKDLTTENFVFLEGVSIEGGGLVGGLGTLTSKNTFSMEGEAYNLGGEVEVNNGRMNVEGIESTLKEGDAQIVRITPEEVRLNLLHLKDPMVRLTGDAAQEETDLEKEVDDEAVKKAVEERESRPHLAVKKFLLEEGRVEYRSPDLKYNIKNILVDVDNFTTEKNREFSGMMEGGLTGTGRAEAEFVSSLERDWDFNPTSFNIEGNFEISNLDLLDFREYLSHKLPNEIDSGKLYYKGDVSLEKGKFKGENLIIVKTVYIGDNTEVKSAVPLKLAVNILKDRKGNLELNVPVSGDFNDPKFGVYRVVLHAIRNILVKAATSPVNILSKTFRLGTGNVISLEYDYLATTPKVKYRSTLKKVVQMMEEKEEVDVVFTLFTNREEEKRVLNEKLREEKFFKRDTKDEELEEKVDEIMAERKREIEDYFKGRLLEKRVKVEISDLPRDRPRSNIDFVID
ncbi:hypothetical protein PM10SUCC1_24650 [Propionigenium maris DSM 9537]|uniref:Uncharacterized protein n=1 Tax=Propionigenium maris DSM 9537 TaxID=1123000 RepID=A0A9W6GND9_9FUSO|nr:DUF748 domain-containing protein [Propionigenium maris]GLI56951.1 hypothetical protein PM10SUCC1_24650 [Propionigenium maris DSM 9537]